MSKLRTVTVIIWILTIVRYSEGTCTVCTVATTPNATNVASIITTIFDSTNYNKLVFPSNSYDTALEVDIQLKLYAITNFDEVAGTLEIVGEVIVKWKDPFLVKNYNVGTHVAMEVYLPQDDIWKPPVTVFNSVTALKTVGDDDYEVLVSLITGEVIWQPALLTQTTCSVNAAFYPFDTQNCKITFTNWGYKTSEITFNPSLTTVDVNSFQDNVEWDLTESSVTSYNTSSKSFVDFELTLVRRPIFFLVNMLIPIILLGILNALVFVLPADSGERIGFAVNVFLTFAVYLTILAENLPKTSSPLSQLSYYVTVMLSVSSLTTLMTILGLRIYDKDYETWVPLYLAYIVAVLTCRYCSDDPRYQLPEPDTDSEENFDSDSDSESVPTLEDMTGNRFGITYRDVGNTCDIVLFLLFIGGTIGVGVLFLMPLFQQA